MQTVNVEGKDYIRASEIFKDREIKESTLYGYVENGLIEHFKIGRNIFVCIESTEKCIAEKKKAYLENLKKKQKPLTVEERLENIENRQEEIYELLKGHVETISLIQETSAIHLRNLTEDILEIRNQLETHQQKLNFELDQFNN